MFLTDWLQVKMKKYLSLDLELNNGPETEKPKIIQVGICIADLGAPTSEWLVKKWYLDPQEPIFEFIVGLTGITDQDIAMHAVSHDQMAAELSALIVEHDIFINPVVWGGGDSSELLEEIKERNIHFPHFGRRWIDIKTIHTFLSIANNKNPSGGLSSVMGQYKIRFEGKAHRADVDAFNTMKLFAHFVKRQSIVNNLIDISKSLV